MTRLRQLLCLACAAALGHVHNCAKQRLTCAGRFGQLCWQQPHDWDVRKCDSRSIMCCPGPPSTLAVCSFTAGVPAGDSAALRAWCSGANSLLAAWARNYTSTLQRYLIDLRLGDMRTTGKAAVSGAAAQALRSAMLAALPELVLEALVAPYGTQPYDDPVQARLDTLQRLYVDGIKYQTLPQRAALSLTRRVVYAANSTLVDLRARALARLAELADQQADARGIPIPSPLKAPYRNISFPNATVGELLDAFMRAGASVGRFLPRSLPYQGALPGAWYQGSYMGASLPPAADTLLGALRVDYNLVAWDGGPDAYQTCDLRRRAPEYEGACTPMASAVACAPTAAEAVPFTCAIGAAADAVVPGNMSDASYRTQCEVPCTRRADCETVCLCSSACGAFEYCACSACIQNGNAAYDAEFQAVLNGTQESSAAAIADVGAEASMLLCLTTADAEPLTSAGTLLASPHGTPLGSAPVVRGPTASPAMAGSTKCEVVTRDANHTWLSVGPGLQPRAMPGPAGMVSGMHGGGIYICGGDMLG